MITRVQVKNFRSLADVDVTLGPLTVLVGRNGAGKSNFVDVIRFVSDAMRFGLDAAITKRKGMTVIRRVVPTEAIDVEISLTVETEQLHGEYAFVIGGEQQGEYRVKRETCQLKESAESSVVVEFETVEGKWHKPPSSEGFWNGFIIDPKALVLPTVSAFSSSFLSVLHHFLTHTRCYTIFPSALREPQKPLSEYPLMEHGENLASVLRQLREKGEWFPDILAALGQVVDDVSDIDVREVGSFLVTVLKHEEQGGSPAWFDLAMESDGTLRVLGLLVALYQSPLPYRSPVPWLIAIEEPELFVHPGALGMLSEVLREATQRSQVLITTQSPDLISYFGADELRVVEKQKGVTNIGPVDDRQRKILNEQLFSAGDLLRIEGLRRIPVAITGGDNA